MIAWCSPCQDVQISANTKMQLEEDFVCISVLSTNFRERRISIECWLAGSLTLGLILENRGKLTQVSF